jgi:hypothetical protein
VAIWYILWSFGTFSRFGMLYQQKSGNPVTGSRNELLVQLQLERGVVGSQAGFCKAANYLHTVTWQKFSVTWLKF